MKTVVQIILTIAIIGLAYLLYDSIMNPIRFNKELDKRSNATIERLKEIRKAQVAYKSVHGNFAGSFDTLLNFIATEEFTIIRAIGSLTPEQIDAGITEEMAIKQGIITREEVKVPVMDSLFHDGYDINQLKYVPFTEGEMFQMGAVVLETGSQVKVPVFEAKVHYNILLHGLDKQLVINIIDEKQKLDRYPGIKVGDLEEPNNNAGNWE